MAAQERLLVVQAGSVIVVVVDGVLVGAAVAPEFGTRGWGE